MRALFKWLELAPLLFLYVLVSCLIRVLPVMERTKRVLAIHTISFFARVFLPVLGVRVHVKHKERLSAGGDIRLVIANHLSYIDVLVLSSLVPSVFITSVELRSTALLGTLTRLSGCLFVERRRPAGLKREIATIARVLGQSMPVVLFPEGTTSNGDRVQPFKNSLFDAAIATRTDIFPICLRYTRVNSEHVTRHNRDTLFYYGGVSFFKHFSRLLALKSFDVEVLPLNAIHVQAHHSRKDLAALAHGAISAAYHG